jgi:hypothetical protein
MNGRQPSITLGNKENEKIGFLNREKQYSKELRKYFTMKSLILAQDER